MTLEAFAPSQPLTLGVELELQLLSTHDYDLTPYAADMLRLMRQHHPDLPGTVVPEMTRSMIEISTGICQDGADALAQLTQIRNALVACADKLNIAIAGGGTHPFQQWHERRIYEKERFHQLSKLYGYLTKQFTIFGQHVHIGCPDADAALLMLHRMSRYIPHCIALSASSPFVQGQDTAFDSARLNSVFAFPLSGRAPCVLTWAEFGQYFNKMTATGVVQGMKDFYWDIRPSPNLAPSKSASLTPHSPSNALPPWPPTCRRWGRGFWTPSPLRPARTTTSCTPSTAFRPAALGWRGCTWIRPTGRTCRWPSIFCAPWTPSPPTRTAIFPCCAPASSSATTMPTGCANARRTRRCWAKSRAKRRCAFAKPRPCNRDKTADFLYDFGL